ncbi:MAG: hypothetical protein IPP96_17765 [Chitinophagaceae bacterium]|nr:hypothetical protein [Chitinophagaceae bacterium]
MGKRSKEKEEPKEKKEKISTKIEPVKIDSTADTDGDGILDINDKCLTLKAPPNMVAARYLTVMVMA